MRTTRFELHVPTRTILRLLLWAFLVSAAIKLWPELVFLSLSLLLAVALGPAVNRMTHLGLGRGASVALIALGVLGVAALFVVFVLPPLVHQGGEVAANFPAFREQAQQHLPRNPFIRSVANQVLQLPSSPEVVRQLTSPWFGARSPFQASPPPWW